MNMTFHDFAQGSHEWLVHRAQHFNASDAPAMMGCSLYQTRTELLTRMKTGIAAEVDAGTQKRFDDGHRFEALARPLAEKIIGQELYPVTGSRDELSASFDGLTDGIDGPYIAFEHKTLNADLAGLVWASDTASDFLPLQYRVQMEQQMAVSGADRVLFMASKWSGDTLVEERHCWYHPDAELRAKIIAGWAQFAKDLVEFVPSTVELPKPTGKAPETLPALHIVLKGEVSASNLDEFKEVALTAIRSVNRDLQTDQDFADSAKARKWCEDIEAKVEGAKQHALSQTASIDTLFRTMNEISAEARVVRLELEKLEKARNLSINSEVVADGVKQFADYISALNAAMPANYMPTVPADFGGCIKNLRTVASKKNAVATELARVKIIASEIATRIQTNIGLLDAANAPMLFADKATLVLKQPDDLAAVIAQRLAAEQQRKEAERERIRAEEAARLEREAEAARKVQEAAEEMARKREQDEADRLVDTKKVATDPLPFIPVVENDPAVNAGLAAVFGFVEQFKHGITPDQVEPTDNGARLTLGQINERLAPISIAVAGLSALGFEPVAVVKAARMYRACDFPAMCAAISEHVLKASQHLEAA